MLALSLVLVWVIGGFFVGFANTLYQLVINTATTIVTFLMVFLIQADVNRTGVALQVKLNELIRASESRNAFIGLEELSSEEIEMAKEMILKERNKG